MLLWIVAKKISEKDDEMTIPNSRDSKRDGIILIKNFIFEE